MARRWEVTGLDPSRLNKRAWNERRLLGLRDGHGHPGGARDGSPGRRPPAQDALQGGSHYSLVDVSLFMPLRWARPDDSTGSSRGAWGVRFRAK